MSTKILSLPIILVIALIYVIFEGGRLIWQPPYTPKQANLTWKQRYRLRTMYAHIPNTTKSPRFMLVTLLVLFIIGIVLSLNGRFVPQVIVSGAWLVWLAISWWFGRQQLDQHRNYWLAKREQSPFVLINDEQAQGRRIQFNRLVVAAVIVVLDYGFFFH